MNSGSACCRAGKRPLPSPSPRVDYFPFANGGVLFFRGSHRLWALNAVSAFLWRELHRASSLDDLAGALARRFAIDADRALQDATAAVSGFAREGLLGEEEAAPQDLLPEAGAGENLGSLLVAPSQWGLRRSFQTLGHRWEFCCADARFGETFTRHLDHLASACSDGADTSLALLPSGGYRPGWDLYLDGRCYRQGVLAHEVLPNLFTLVFVRASEALAARFLIHAAVLVRDGQGVIFPAETGSGKTTLAATLAARGYGFYSDELAVLDQETLSVYPLPLPMSIKPGSVPVLVRDYPHLAGATSYLRADGKQVRYLLPPPATLPGADARAVPVRALVFPSYASGQSTRFEVIDPCAALQRLAMTGSSDRPLGRQDVKAMIALAEGRDSYHLVYSRLDEAVACLEAQLFGREP